MGGRFISFPATSSVATLLLLFLLLTLFSSPSLVSAEHLNIESLRQVSSDEEFVKAFENAECVSDPELIHDGYSAYCFPQGTTFSSTSINLFGGAGMSKKAASAGAGAGVAAALADEVTLTPDGSGRYIVQGSPNFISTTVVADVTAAYINLVSYVDFYDGSFIDSVMFATSGPSNFLSISIRNYTFLQTISVRSVAYASCYASFLFYTSLVSNMNVTISDSDFSIGNATTPQPNFGDCGKFVGHIAFADSTVIQANTALNLVRNSFSGLQFAVHMRLNHGEPYGTITGPALFSFIANRMSAQKDGKYPTTPRTDLALYYAEYPLSISNEVVFRFRDNILDNTYARARVQFFRFADLAMSGKSWIDLRGGYARQIAGGRRSFMVAIQALSMTNSYITIGDLEAPQFQPGDLPIFPQAFDSNSYIAITNLTLEGVTYNTAAEVLSIPRKFSFDPTAKAVSPDVRLITSSADEEQDCFTPYTQCYGGTRGSCVCTSKGYGANCVPIFDPVFPKYTKTCEGCYTTPEPPIMTESLQCWVNATFPADANPLTFDFSLLPANASMTISFEGCVFNQRDILFKKLSTEAMMEGRVSISMTNLVMNGAMIIMEDE